MKHVIWLPILTASLCLWSCSRVIGDVPDRSGTDTDISGYIGIELKDAYVSSRADNYGSHRDYYDRLEDFEWFNEGTADERAIIDNPACNRILFFNEDGSFFGCYNLQKPSIKTASSNIYVAKTPLVSDGAAYALVVLNGDAARMNQLAAELEAYKENTDQGTAIKKVLYYINTLASPTSSGELPDPESVAMAVEDKDGPKYFTMSSTVYQDKDTKSIVALTPLRDREQIFFETEEDAVKSENLTTFYVERLLAKFTLLFDENGDMVKFTDYKKRLIVNGPNKMNVREEYAPYDTQNKDKRTDWKVNVVNWGLNGLEKDTYLVKTLVKSSDAAEYPWPIENNFYSAWNSPFLSRSYWALDPNYDGGTYPDQYRQALDVANVTSATTNNIYSAGYEAEKGLEEEDYTLIYKSYNAYQNNTENKYSLENTFDPSILSGQDLSSQPWLRCGTHIILTAQLIFDEFDKDINLEGDKPGFIERVSDKYFSNGLWWTEKALMQQAVATLMTNIYYNKPGNDRVPNVFETGEYVDPINTSEHMLDDVTPLAVKENGVVIPLKHEDLAEIASNYFELAPAFIKGGDGWVTLKKKDDVELYGYYLGGYNDDGTKENYTLEQPISDEVLVSYIYRFTNLAKHFKEGRMYYALPIRHNLESNSFKNDPVTEVRTGDYGVVRNTWYRLTITSINKPGTPVDDPNQPIIPNPEPNDKSLGVEVRVIPWEIKQIGTEDEGIQLH